MKNDDSNPIHSDWQNLTIKAKFQEFRIIGFAKYVGPSFYNALDDDCDIGSFDLDDNNGINNGITPVAISSEPS